MFFGYFLNIKKVTPSADFVIGPAKAEAFLFSHTRLPFPPRPLLPFGRISPAAKPGWPVTGPAFWVCRAKAGAAFRCARSPCAAVCFAAPASPSRTAVLLLSLFAVFALVCSPPRFQSGFFCAKTGGRVPPLSDGGALTKPENIILCASSCHPPRSPYPHCTLPHVRFSGIGQKKKPQRKTAAAVAYHSLFLSFRLCGTRSPACFVIRIHSTSLSSRGENKKGKRARFPFLLCSERLISARSAFSLFSAALVPDAARLIRTHKIRKSVV